MPSLVDRPAQRYVAERAILSIPEFPQIADRLPHIIGTLAAQGIAPAGPPFFRYRVIHPGMRFTVESGVPIAGGFTATEPMFVDELPAGKYVTSTYVGAPDGLAAATAEVLEWGAGEGVRWDSREGADGEEWAARLEVLLTNPLEQPDPAQWVTELVFKLTSPYHPRRVSTAPTRQPKPAVDTSARTTFHRTHEVSNAARSSA